MLPPRLFSTYQRYKQDTDIIAAWLASTAVACGYPADRLKHQPATTTTTTTTATASTGRLKGKERKDAKRVKQGQGQRQGSQPKSTAKPKRKHIIAVAEFVPLADFIASSESPSASVPDFFAGALSRVISLRSSFRDRMSGEGMAEDAASDEQHNYFVQVLEQVRTALKPAMPAGASEPGELPVLNSFEALKLYEPSQSFLDAPDAPRPDQDQAPVSVSDTAYEAEQLAALEELLFAWTVMINDLTALRSRIKWIWGNHRDGLFDAAAAALATNTAIDLARSIMDDVLPLTDRHGGCWRMAQAFYISQCMARGMSHQAPGLADNFNYETYDIAGDTFIAVYRLIDSFLTVLDPRDLPIFKEGHFGVYDPRSDRRAKLGKAKAQEDKILLMQLFTEQMTVIRLLPGYPVEDEFLRGMKELDKTRKVSLHLAFAAQVHLDIHHELRVHAARASEALLQASQTFDDEIAAFLDFHKSFKCNTWPAANDNTLRQVQNEMRMVRSDPIYQAKARVLRRMGMPASPDLRPHLLLSWSPIVSGLMLFRFRAHSWHMGMVVNQAWGSILYSAHLYNALQMERRVGGSSIGSCWQDMDVTQTLFGSESFYVGDRPTTRPDYFSKFCLSVGVSAATFAQRGNAGGRKVPLASKAGPRGCLEGDPSVSKMFFGRYLEDSGQFDWTPEHVNNIVSHSRYEQERSDEGGLVLVQSDKALKQRQQEAAARGPFSPPELVEKLAFSLQAESLELSFLYLRMHRACWTFLRAIRDACDSELRRLFTPAYLERESQLPFVVGWIFSALCAGGSCTAEQAEGLLRTCGLVVDDMAARGDGAAVCRAMQEQVGFSFSFEEEDEEEG